MSVSPLLPPRSIKVSGLVCWRGDKMLFENLSFTAAPGEIVLLRGPNGVGKTTLLMALAGIMGVSEGSIEFSGAGEDERPSADRHLLGHLSAVKPRLSVGENLAFWAALNGGPSRNSDDVLDEVGLDGLTALDAGVLSAGQTRRLALARLLVSPRPIWLLDEPTAALDRAGEALVARLLDRHIDSGGIAIATTHHDLALKDLTRVKTLTLGDIG